MVVSRAMGFSPGRRVRVQRSGNSKVMPVPAEAGREAHVELGEEFVLEVSGSDLLYRAVSLSVELIGVGSDRAGLLSADHVVAAPQRTAIPALDWDF